MSCNNRRNGPCCPDTPYPQVSHESVPSLIDNLVNALYGSISKCVKKGRVIWNIPCDPSDNPVTIDGFPRLPGEGLLCYIIRYFDDLAPILLDAVTISGAQTILGQKTFTLPVLGDAINNTLAQTIAGNKTFNWIKLPVGTTGTRPSGETGLVRFNTDSNQFEGYNNTTWTGIGDQPVIKANAVQVGQSPTATYNFTLAVPSSPDGTIKLARGNSGATTQDVLTVSNIGVVSFPQGLATSSITANVIGNVTGNTTGNLTGDVFASNGTSKVLENGTNGTDATFTGSVSGGTLSGNASSATTLATGSTTARSLANRFADFVSPLDFGAVGDGVTDDLAGVKLALESGRPVDGAGKTYAISGTCQPTSFVGLQNADFIQIGNTSTDYQQVLKIVGFSDFFIDNVSINMGSNVNTLYNDSGNSGLYVGGASETSFSENFTITRISVTGNGCGSGIQIRHSKRFTISECLVHDRVSGSTPDPTNDSQNGIQIVNCSNFVLANSNVYNLLTRLSGVNTLKWTRGFLFSEIRDATIVGCNSTTTDQGFDFSGAYVNGGTYTYTGNRRFVISGCTANSSGTYGFKFANVTKDALVNSCIANNTGSIGFVFSASSVALPSGLENLITQNIDVVGCKVVNVTGGLSQGFRVMSNSIYSNYPRGIRIKSCSVLDTQDTKTTLTGFASDSAPVEYPTLGYNTAIANTITNCNCQDGITFATGNIGLNICQIKGSGNQSIPSGSSLSPVPLNWDTDIIDPTGLHSIAGNINAIFIKTAGWYRVSAQVQFAANALGIRGLLFTNTGTVIPASTVEQTATTGIITLCASTIVFLGNGNNISASVYQNSGSSLNAVLSESHFMITKIDG